MKILALETSAKACSAAVTENGQVIAYAFQNMPHRYDLSQLEILETFLSLVSRYSGIDAKALFTDQEWLVLEKTLH